MRIKLHNGLQQPLSLEATSVVIEDAHGNILFAAQQAGQQEITYTHIDDPAYKEILRQMGIYKTLIVQDLGKEKPLSNVIWD
jgi:hypothetical protein